MSLWLIRVGRHGEFEQQILGGNRLYLTWGRLDHDLGALRSQEDLEKILTARDPQDPPGRISNHLRQIWAFAKKMKSGDWVIVPRKSKPAVAVAEITGDYRFEPQGEDRFRHVRNAKWIAMDIPRANFDKDLLFSFGAVQTVCEIKRHDAEARIRAMAKSGWKAQEGGSQNGGGSDAGDEVEVRDFERDARDSIAATVQRRFQGHELTNLVDAILRAQGYTTFVSPPGTDKGVDILASPGPLGFGTPRLCVQVKSGDSPVDRPTLDQLIGVMQNMNADQGLLVSWGGFKTTVEREEPAQFFRVRLWDADDIVNGLLEHYERLPEDLRAEIPLKRIWAPTAPDDREE